MSDFSKLMLIEGIEEILVNPKFETGTSIVTTIKVLIERGVVANEGKVKTIISEREAVPAAEATGVVTSQASTEDLVNVQATATSTSTESVLPQQQQRPLPPPISIFPEVIAMAQKLDAKMKEDAQQFMPQLAALISAIDSGVDLVEQLNRPIGEVGGVPVSDQTAMIMQRIDRLPKRYLDILLQLLGNWEKQSK